MSFCYVWEIRGNLECLSSAVCCGMACKVCEHEKRNSLCICECNCPHSLVDNALGRIPDLIISANRPSSDRVNPVADYSFCHGFPVQDPAFIHFGQSFNSCFCSIGHDLVHPWDIQDFVTEFPCYFSLQVPDPWTGMCVGACDDNIFNGNAGFFIYLFSDICVFTDCKAYNFTDYEQEPAGFIFHGCCLCLYFMMRVNDMIDSEPARYRIFRRNVFF